MAAKMCFEYIPAGGDGRLFAHALKPPAIPCLLAAFHDHCRGIGVKLIGMDPHPAMFGVFKNEGESVVEFLVGAKPDKFAKTGVDIGFEMVLKLAPHRRIDAVTSHYKIIVGLVFTRCFELGFKLQVDVKVARAGLKDHQQPLAPDPGKSVPAGNQSLTLMDHRDIIPIGEMFTDGFSADRVVLLHVSQRVVRQDHTPAESVISLVTFNHGHVV